LKEYCLALLFLHAVFAITALSGLLTFGNVLGDVVYIFLSIFLCLLFASLYPYASSSRFTKAHIPLSLLITVVLIFLCLKATVFRGPEYSWANRSIFFDNNKQ
jgi:hypothetical protein